MRQHRFVLMVAPTCHIVWDCGFVHMRCTYNDNVLCATFSKALQKYTAQYCLVIPVSRADHGAMHCAGALQVDITGMVRTSGVKKQKLICVLSPLPWLQVYYGSWPACRPCWSQCASPPPRGGLQGEVWRGGGSRKRWSSPPGDQNDASLRALRLKNSIPKSAIQKYKIGRPKAPKMSSTS